MSIKELPYRLNQLIKKKYESHFDIGKNFQIKKEIKSKYKSLKIDWSGKEIFDNEILIFGVKWNYANNAIDWQQDILSGKTFPIEYAKSINIRKDPELSAKNVWEINRLQFLPQIAINYQITNDEKYLEQSVMITESWIDSNPYLSGINWYSNIEVNIRLINWYFCWIILDVEKIKSRNKHFGEFVNRKWIPSINLHCLYSYKNPSKFSSANNHLISEYAGLFVAASLWKFNDSAKWLKYSRSGLETEITRQHSNGINKEEAAEYIQFITDFFLLPYILALQTGQPFSENYKNTLKSIFDYIYEFTDLNTNFPKYGDEDNGKVILLSSDQHFNNFKSLLTTAAILFDDMRFKSKSAGFDLKNEVLLGLQGKSKFENLENEIISQNSAFYEIEGHFIFRKQVLNKEIYLHFDAAPLGYLSIAAHGHADALSFSLNINGIPIFVDSGTYSYHVEKKWRDYFVSTLAHNTICVDDGNQARHVGDTMWLNHFSCKIHKQMQSAVVDSVKANHNGYRQTIHSREITFNKNSDTFLIHDEVEITDGKEHNFKTMFHLHPEVKIVNISSEEAILIHPSGINISLLVEGSSELKKAKGQENPILGWYSDSFMQKEPTTVLFSNKNTNQSFQSKIKIEIYEY
jgi:hypothetical protein